LTEYPLFSALFIFNAGKIPGGVCPKT